MIKKDDDGFLDSDKIQDTVLNSFSFNKCDSTPASSVDFSYNTSEFKIDALEDNRKDKTIANIAIPAIDDEPYTIGRYYKLRYSTAKMLNEIKASHPDVNVYMNTIVDEAIRYYYGILFQGRK